MMGSGVFVGAFPLDMVLQRPDLDGITVGEALNKIGFAGPEKVGGRPVGAYFEAHIEQGPILEDEKKVLGVVVGALGLRWYDVVVNGQDAHAGPTPMRLRKDALLAASRIVAEINALAYRYQPNGRGTVGLHAGQAQFPQRGTRRGALLRGSAPRRRRSARAHGTGDARRLRAVGERRALLSCASSGSPTIRRASSTPPALPACATPRRNSA